MTTAADIARERTILINLDQRMVSATKDYMLAWCCLAASILLLGCVVVDRLIEDARLYELSQRV